MTTEFRSEDFVCICWPRCFLFCPETNQKTSVQLVDGNMCSRMINTSCENVTVDRKQEERDTELHVVLEFRRTNADPQKAALSCA